MHMLNGRMPLLALPLAAIGRALSSVPSVMFGLMLIVFFLTVNVRVHPPYESVLPLS